MSRRLLSAAASLLFIAAAVCQAAWREAPPVAEGAAAPQGRGGRGGAPGAGQSAQGAATNDFTGYWVTITTEDWRWLMAVPDRGNAESIPISPAGRTALNAWDPAKDEAEGNQCRGYGAAAISRLPARVHVTWEDANTLKWETDQGMQTRLFRFGAAAQQAEANPGPRSWQGTSTATWEPTAGGRGGFPGGGIAGPPGPAGPAPPPAAGRGGAQTGWLKVVTTNLKSGYLRKNGLPYSEKATVTEYFQPTPETYGVRYMIVTTIVEDPDYLTGPLITSSNYKKLPDTNNGWDPQPCSVR